MLVRLLIGGVTLAAAGYAAKEYCEERGCPWDDEVITPSPSYEHKQEKEPAEKVSYEKAREFHKRKKALYKTSMKTYREFLEKHNIKDDTLQTDTKLLKQKFPDTIIDDEISSYMEKIINTLETLSYNLALHIKFVGLDENKEIDDESLQLIQTYAKNIYALAHVAFFIDPFSNETITKFKMSDTFYRKKLNKEGLLSTLVDAMSLSVKKESIHVDLSGETDESVAS